MCGGTKYIFPFFLFFVANTFPLIIRFFFFLRLNFSQRGGGRNGSWLPCPVVVEGLDGVCGFEIVLSCLLGGKACTRRAEEVGEEEEVTGAVILLSTANSRA